jgi:hypothetical protein
MTLAGLGNGRRRSTVVKHEARALRGTGTCAIGKATDNLRAVLILPGQGKHGEHGLTPVERGDAGDPAPRLHEEPASPHEYRLQERSKGQ